jgi:hypothetical protein
MEELTYEQTEVRKQILAGFDEAQAALVKVADLLRETPQKDRVHKTLNAAQSGACVKSLLEGDWAIEDAEKAAEGEQESDAGSRAA